MMNIILLLFMIIPLALIGLLFRAVQPLKHRFTSIDEALEALSGQRHYQRSP